MKEPTIATPHELFTQSARYKAPVFQRLYVWGKTQLVALIDDIDSGEQDSPQFLGAIVLQDLGKPQGPTSPNSYLMIDGQQRLTTLYLILAALAEIAQRHGATDVADYVRNEYLGESKSPSFKGQPKLVPTLQDRDTLWQILDASQPKVQWNFKPDPGDGKKGKNRLEAQWVRIQEALEEYVLDDKGRLVKEKLVSFLDHTQSGLQVICITLESTDDANVIFSKLNAEGVELSLADLVRNEVFSKFPSTDGKKADRFYETKWHSFEKSFSKESDLNGFFPVYSYIAFKGKVTKAAAFPQLQKRWDKSSPAKILSELETYAPYYQALSTGKPLATLSKNLNGMVARFSRMPRTTVTWPYIAQLLHASSNSTRVEKQAIKCLEIVEAFLVRRALIGVEPTGLHAVFKTLWERAGMKPKEVLEKITTRTIKCPEDVELRKRLVSEPVDTRVVMNYVLGEYERDYRRVNRYDSIPETVVTIEHVMPKSRGAAWPQVADAKKYDALVGLIGNLVPLSEEQNKGVKDQPWSEKRKRFRGSNFQTTQTTAKVNAWDADQIEERTETVADWIKKRWPSMDSFRQ